MNDLVRNLEILLRKKKMTLIIDFDYTITTNNSNSSIGVFSYYLPKEYVVKKKKLDFLTKILRFKVAYKYIWKAKLKLLEKYNAENVLKSIDYKGEFNINYDVIELIEVFVRNKCRIVIYSSGIKEVILGVLKIYGLNYEGIEIISNSLGYKSIVTPYKRHLNYLEDVFLIGDKKQDLKVSKSNYIIQVTNNKPIVIRWGCCYKKYKRNRIQ